MEEIFNMLGQFIAQIGFPIAAFILMFFQNKETTKVVEENTKALIELKDKIDR